MTGDASKTILVADDDAAIRTVVTQALTRAGYDVRATGTASSLWHWVVSGEGDLVITDVVLPDRPGVDLVRQLPAGLQTQLGATWPQGVDLSFGQWQKLALARGFMRDRRGG